MILINFIVLVGYNSGAPHCQKADPYPTSSDRGRTNPYPPVEPRTLRAGHVWIATFCGTLKDERLGFSMVFLAFTYLLSILF